MKLKNKYSIQFKLKCLDLVKNFRNIWNFINNKNK